LEVPVVAKQARAVKRQRRERGSINPNHIIDGAFELAEQVGIDNLSMPLLGKHLGVGVTSIYWHFRKKDDLLDAMTDRALRQFAVASPHVEAKDWRETLGDHARGMREAFLNNPILSDLILIRSALSPRAAQLCVLDVEKAVERLVEAGLSPQQAGRTYSSMSLHVRGSVVLQRLYEKNRAIDNRPGTFEEAMVFDDQAAPLLAELTRAGHHVGAADDSNFEYGLQCILDNAERLIAAGKKAGKPARTAKAAKGRRSRAAS
jgi:AcrR family transcriptional regulator